jgi:opacity protein-like surface antigen
MGSGLGFRIAFISLALGGLLSAQEFRIGFIAGTPITSNVVPATSASSGSAFFPSYDFTTETGARSFIAGLSLEALLNSRFSIEADALHRDYRAKEILTLNPGSSSASTTTNEFLVSTTWEFPVLFKYTIGTNRWQPFVDGGMSFRSFERTSVLDPSRYGYTAGAGVAVALGRIQLTPQLRYTRWALQSHLNGNYEFKQDQSSAVTQIRPIVVTSKPANRK